MTNKGKLIIIEGGDGSGKTTQAKLLLDYFKNLHLPTFYFDFPQYHTFYGELVAKFLRGELGEINEVSPYIAALLFALDRLAVQKEMSNLLEQGSYIVANRYITSNMAHQGAKFTQYQEREKFLYWLTQLEYKQHNMPKEDLVIYLYIPWELSKKLTSNKGQRTYLQGKEDIHEKDDSHRQQTEKIYLELAKQYPHWFKIDCVQDGKILSKEQIHEKIIKILVKKIYS